MCSTRLRNTSWGWPWIVCCENVAASFPNISPKWWIIVYDTYPGRGHAFRRLEDELSQAVYEIPRPAGHSTKSPQALHILSKICSLVTSSITRRKRTSARSPGRSIGTVFQAVQPAKTPTHLPRHPAGPSTKSRQALRVSLSETCTLATSSGSQSARRSPSTPFSSFSTATEACLGTLW